MQNKQFIKTIALAFIILFTSTLTYAQRFTIEDIPLKWNDFTAKEGFRNHPYDAKIYTQIQPGNYKRKGDKITFGAELFVDKEKSWVKEEFMEKSNKEVKEKLLSHEKGHLIIALIEFKQLETNLARFPYSRNYKKEMDSIYKACYHQLQLVNDTYDNETNHMKITDKQEEWIKKLLKQLNELYAEDKKLTMKFEIEISI